MTISISKKQIFIGVGLLFILVLSSLFFLNNQNKVKVENYKASAKEMKINSMAASYICLVILKDYHDTWSSAISHYGNEEAMIKERYNYYKNKGVLDKVEKFMAISKRDMEKMYNAPSDFEKTQHVLDGLYNDMNTCYGLVKNPSGSLNSFGSKIVELLNNVENKNKETNIQIPISSSDIRTKINELTPLIGEIGYSDRFDD